VSIADAAQLALSMGREAAVELMGDECTIVRLGEPSTDPDSVGEPPPSAQLYPDPEWPEDHPWKHGPCKVQGLDPQELNPEVGGAILTVQRYRVDIPVGGYAPAVGDVVALGVARFDPNLTGRKYRVVALLHKSYATAYRLAVEEA
jgi:hypothetical protein